MDYVRGVLKTDGGMRECKKENRRLKGRRGRKEEGEWWRLVKKAAIAIGVGAARGRWSGSRVVGVEEASGENGCRGRRFRGASKTTTGRSGAELMSSTWSSYSAVANGGRSFAAAILR